MVYAFEDGTEGLLYKLYEPLVLSSISTLALPDAHTNGSASPPPASPNDRASTIQSIPDLPLTLELLGHSSSTHLL